MWPLLTILLACTGADLAVPEPEPVAEPPEPINEPELIGEPEPIVQAEPTPEPMPAPAATDSPAQPIATPVPAQPPKPIEPPKPTEPPPVVVAPTPDEPAPVAAPPPPPTTAYLLDPHQGRLYVVSHIDTSTMLASMGHDHAIGATGWSGSVTWPNEPGAACAVDIVVPVSGLVVDPKGYRVAAGLDPQEVSEADKAKITDNFRGPKQLDSKSFPNIEFHATQCTASGAAMKVTGDFTMHGVTRSKTVTITPTIEGSSFRATGSFAINGSDFGMDPFTAAAGALRNLDRLEFTLDLKGSAR